MLGLKHFGAWLIFSVFAHITTSLQKLLCFIVYQWSLKDTLQKTNIEICYTMKQKYSLVQFL